MKRSHKAPHFMEQGTKVVLEALLNGPPLPLPEMPRRWPVTRPMLTHLVAELKRAGLVAPVPSGRIPGGVAYGLTYEGRAQAEGLARPAA